MRVDQLATKKNISIVYFNKTPVEGLQSFRNILFKLNLGLPRPYNVLIPSLIKALNLGYKELYVIGADHSWLEELRVNDKNEALLNQKHFYDYQTSKFEPMYHAKRGGKRVHEILYKLMKAFEGYFYIREYAESLGSQIYNATPNSYIDAFERRSLNQIK